MSIEFSPHNNYNNNDTNHDGDGIGGRSFSFSGDHSSSHYGNGGNSTPFFADATLDLDEAHDCAETPEAVPRSTILQTESPLIKLQLPSLDVALQEDNVEEKMQFTRITSQLPSDTTKNLAIPKWPRDLSWAIGFWVYCPVVLLVPTFLNRGATKTALETDPQRACAEHATLAALAASFVVARFFYAGSGDNARHGAAALLTKSAPSGLAGAMALALFAWWALPGARVAVAVPCWFIARDVWLFRQWKQRWNSDEVTTTAAAAGTGSRQAFFQALVCMALEILSRSLRRQAFYRALTILLLVQFGVVHLWRWALLAAMGTQNWLLLVLVAIAGKWATGTVTRLLSLLACGGVTHWFIHQSELLQQWPERLQSTDDDDQAKIEDTDPNRHNIPDAYRTVDASVYQSVLAMDDALDDDFGIDEDELENGYATRADAGRPTTAAANTHQQQHHVPTVKSILWAGLTVSFGSVAQCGLFGGLAQYVWSQIRKVEVAGTAIQQLRQARLNNRSGASGFQGMPIGQNHSGAIMSRFGGPVNRLARGFVQRFSDLAMTHVAAYYKSYHIAARDVALLIDESGVEPIIHDDITTHMCACVGGAISSVIVIVTGYVLVHQRKNSSPRATDWEVAETMLLSFILSYTLLFTVMEPLRASIKAVYVSFAQNPRALSQAYPLIYHRLSRLSESQVS
jgi:hypothetical protein